MGMSALSYQPRKAPYLWYIAWSANNKDKRYKGFGYIFWMGEQGISPATLKQVISNKRMVDPEDAITSPVKNEPRLISMNLTVRNGLPKH